MQFKRFKNSFEIGSELLSIWKLKSPVIIILLHVVCTIDNRSENSRILFMKEVERLGGL